MTNTFETQTPLKFSALKPLNSKNVTQRGKIENTTENTLGTFYLIVALSTASYKPRTINCRGCVGCAKVAKFIHIVHIEHEQGK